MPILRFFLPEDGYREVLYKQLGYRMDTSIGTILEGRDATLLLGTTHPRVIEDRLYLSKRIATSFEEFERLRDLLMGRSSLETTAQTRTFLGVLEKYGVACAQEGGGWVASDAGSRRYLSGGWLEEYVAAATKEAGADEVLCGQRIAWQAGGFAGENEIDVLARFGDRLFFCSCKALKSQLEPNDSRTRERLTAALHEADNLADHFSPSGSIVALAVTTDLYNERKRMVRYEPLHGKAAALGVNILGAEQLSWTTLIKSIRGFFY